MLKENRVRVAGYGRIVNRSDPRLVPVRSVAGENHVLHHLAAFALDSMYQTCLRETGIQILVTSGWRPHKWKTRAEYEQFLVDTYSKRLTKRIAGMTAEAARQTVIAYGRRWVGFDSPHETGLCLDIGSGGLDAVSATADEQKKTALYAWLSDHASEYGFTPYLIEPWHWEFNISIEQWRS